MIFRGEYMKEYEIYPFKNEKIIKNEVLNINKNNNQRIQMVSVIIAIFLAFALNIQFDKASNWIGFFTKDAFSMFILIFIAGIYFLMNYIIKIKNKRLTICSLILGMIFAVTYFIGYLGETYIDTTIPTSKKFLLFMTLKISAYFLIFSAMVKFLIFNLDKLNKKNFRLEENKYRFFTNNKRSIFIVAILFLVSYIPYILYYYPGTIYYDNIQSLLQVTGKMQYSNFQPILYTVIYGGLWNLGKMIFGSGNAGILLYTTFQAIFASLTFSTILYYMAKRGISLKWRIITLLFLILNPINGMFIVRGEKSFLFHLSLILVVIGIIDLLYEKEKFFHKKWKPIIFVILVLFMAFIRNNGLYVFLIAVPFILIVLRKNKRILIKTSITLIIPIIMIFIIQGPVFHILGVTGTLDREMFSIPAQQIGRIMKYEKENLTDEEREEINKYMDIENSNMEEEYNPGLSDNTKGKIKDEELEKDKIGFIKLYFKLALKYPIHTITALIYNTYSYYAPNGTYIRGLANYNEETKDVLTNWAIEYNPGGINNYKEYDYYPQHLVNFSILDVINEEFSWKRIPIISLLFTGIGFYFWVLLFLITYEIYKRKYKNICIFLPILILWLTNIAGPVVDIRYIYSIILIMPLYIGVGLFTYNKSDENYKE